MTDERYNFGNMRIQKTGPHDWELLLDDHVQPSQIPALIKHLQKIKLGTLRPRLHENNTVLIYSAHELLRDFKSAQSQAIGLAKLNPFLAACMAFHAGALAHRWCIEVEDAFHFPRLSTLPLHETLLANHRLQRCFIFGYMTEQRSQRPWLLLSDASKEQRRLEDAIRLLLKRPRSHARAAQKVRPSLRAYWDALVSWRRWYPPAIRCAPLD